MFSSRLPASLAPNRIAGAVDAARARGPLVDLTETNPTAVGLRFPEATILSAIADPRALAYAPDPRGLAAAREAIAGYYRRHDREVDPQRLFLTASTSDGYAQLFKLLCDPGDRVLTPQPSYPLFELLAGLESVELVPYPIRYSAGWYLDVDELSERIDDRTRAVLVVNPNNPTGSFLKVGERAALSALCATRGVAIISDEVFADYAGAPDPDRVATLVDETAALTFSLSGLSKLVGLPQLKLGWIHLAGPPALVAEADARLELIADTYLSVAAPVQHAAPRLLALVDDVGAQLAERVAKNRAAVQAAVTGTAIGLLQSEGGWSAILRVPRIHTEEEWVLLLLDDGVLVHPGFFFDLAEEAYLVVSLIVPEAVLAEGLARILSRV